MDCAANAKEDDVFRVPINHISNFELRFGDERPWYGLFDLINRSYFIKHSMDCSRDRYFQMAIRGLWKFSTTWDMFKCAVAGARVKGMPPELALNLGGMLAPKIEVTPHL